jgi:hypothetical protein
MDIMDHSNSSRLVLLDALLQPNWLKQASGPSLPSSQVRELFFAALCDEVDGSAG